jgi:hypothetical protein
MVLIGTLPPQAKWLSETVRWPRLSAQNPGFIDALPSLASVLGQLFCRTVAVSPADLAIHGLGRICIEDFIEILFLSEHDFSIGALKLLRGLFERAVTAEVIASDASDSDLFVDYYAVSSFKGKQRAAGVYKGRWPSTERAAEEYEKIKTKYKADPCES